MTDTSETPAPTPSTARTPEPARRGLRFFDVIRLLVTWGLTFLALLLTAGSCRASPTPRGGRWPLPPPSRVSSA